MQATKAACEGTCLGLDAKVMGLLLECSWEELRLKHSFFFGEEGRSARKVTSQRPSDQGRSLVIGL